MTWPKTGVTHYHVQLGLPDKGRAIKGLVVCRDLFRVFGPVKGLALGCYQPSPGGMNRIKLKSKMHNHLRVINTISLIWNILFIEIDLIFYAYYHLVKSDNNILLNVIILSNKFLVHIHIRTTGLK